MPSRVQDEKKRSATTSILRTVKPPSHHYAEFGVVLSFVKPMGFAIFACQLKAIGQPDACMKAFM